MPVATFVLIGLGLVAWLVGGVLLYLRSTALAKTALIERIPTSSAASVAGHQAGQLVEVKGTLRCEAPLTAEMSRRSCAYYSSSVTREYEEQESDSDGVSRTRRQSETVASNVLHTPFLVEDASGTAPVDPERADVDAMLVVDRFEQAGGMPITLGGLTVNLGAGTGTLGYRYRESILPVNAPVYVLGVVRSDGAIAAPAAGSKDQKLIISYRSEEALGQALSSQARYLQVAALGTFVLGAVLVVVGVAVRLA